MERIETLEMNAHREQLIADINRLVEKYRAIFGWDVPDLDQGFSDQLIVGAVREALDAIAANLQKPDRPRRPTN